MVIELQKNEFNIVNNLFNDNLYQIPALSVLNNTFPGKVFVDNKDNPQIALVWALSRWSYVSCQDQLEKHKGFITKVLQDKVFPILKILDENYFEVYADNVLDWDTFLINSLKEYRIEKHFENTYTLNMEKYKSLNLSFEIINDIEIFEAAYPIVPKEYWRYLLYNELDKKVPGTIIKKDGRIISKCLNNGFTYDNKYFIDLDTYENCDRNKGYGTLISYKLINKQLETGLLPLWETTVDNIPSQKVANKLGFEKVEEYPVYSIRNFNSN